MELSVIEKESQDAVLIAKQMTILDNKDEEDAVEFCKVIKRCKDAVGDKFDQDVTDSYGLYKSLYDKREEYLSKLKEAEKIIKKTIKDYRLKLELERQAEEDKQKAILDAQIKSDQDALMAKAEEALAKGDNKTADKLAVQSVSIEAGGVHVASKAVKQDGMSSAVVWKGRVSILTDLPMEFVVISANQKAIDAHIKAHGKNNPIRGVEYYQDVNLSVRK